MTHASTIGVLPGYPVFEGNTISEYLHTVLQGVIAGAKARGCNLLIGCGLDTPTTRGRYTPAWPVSSPDTMFVPVGPWNTDGLIIIPPLVSAERSQFVQALWAEGCPVVFAGPGEPGPAVVTDNQGAVFQAVEHLWQHGHRQIAFIAGLENVSGDSLARLNAYDEAMRSLGVEAQPHWVAYGLHTIEGGKAAMRKLLHSPEPITGVVTSNLRSALGVIQALQDARRAIPEEVAVIGIDDHLAAEAQDPPLTVVHLNTFDLGYRAVELLLDFLRGRRYTPLEISVPAHLVRRRSCGCKLDESALTEVVVERSRRQMASRILRQRELDDALGSMTARLLRTLQEIEILQALQAYLPDLNIRQACIITLEPEEDDPIAWSTFWAIDNAAGNILYHRFPTRQFPPLALHQKSDSFCLALVPLFTQQAQIGYIAFDTHALEQCGAIARQVAAAIQACRLYQEAAEGRRLAEEAGRLKTRFLSTVSHELRTPLSLIVGLSELILREYAEGRIPTQQDLERIYTSSKHLGFLIRDVLDLASSDAGQLRLFVEPLNLTEVFQPVIETGQQLALEKGLDWQAIMPANLPRVLGDRVRLRQVALNLISNATKFTSRGLITLRLEHNREHVMVSVNDTGLGIPSEEQAMIFDEFRQSERTVSRGYGGMGLGLAISKHLIHLHGGEIGVRSTGVEGKGATFYFTLPVYKVLPAADLSALPPGLPILLLTQQPEQAERVREYLLAQGYEVWVQGLTTGFEWKKQDHAIEPAAILFDRQVATDAGWQIVQVLQEDPAKRDIPVLFYTLSADRDSGSLLDLVYLTKPVRPEQLSQVLDRTGAGGQPRAFLVVDDDPYILDLHTRLIQSLLPSSVIHKASNGRKALEVLNSIQPDLVLLDLMMPELDGFGVLEHMRASATMRDIPVVVLTAKALNEADLTRLNQGVVAVLDKGVFTIEETLVHLTAALNRTVKSSNSAQRLVRRAIVYIQAHYTETLSREQIAKYLAVSENYLTNCFQKELGISPLTFINRYRVKQARNLLEVGDQTITEVAMAVGFSDLTYFSRVFQREVGVSPSAFRRGFRRKGVH